MPWLVDEGISVFRSVMADPYSPTPSHYPRLVGMLGQSWKFDDIYMLSLIEDTGEPGVLI
jgi:hypothetical protein